MSQTKVITIADNRAELPEDADALVVALHLQLTAPERHASRVAAVGEALEQFPSAVRRAIAALEVGGIGGPGGYAGDASDRMSWARHLGPRSIPAWQAAFGAHAAFVPIAHEVVSAAAALTVDDREWALAHCLRMVAHHRFSAAGVWAAAAREIAATCEPTSKLARRYDLATMPESITVQLEDADIRKMVGFHDQDQSPIQAGTYWVDDVAFTIGERVRIDVADGVSAYGWEVTVRAARADRPLLFARLAQLDDDDGAGKGVRQLCTYLGVVFVRERDDLDVALDAATVRREGNDLDVDAVRRERDDLAAQVEHLRNELEISQAAVAALRQR